MIKSMSHLHTHRRRRRGDRKVRRRQKIDVWTLVRTLFIILSIHKTNGLSFIRECFEFTLFLVPFFRCHLQHSLRDKSPQTQEHSKCQQILKTSLVSTMIDLDFLISCDLHTEYKVLYLAIHFVFFLFICLFNSFCLNNLSMQMHFDANKCTLQYHNLLFQLFYLLFFNF